LSHFNPGLKKPENPIISPVANDQVETTAKSKTIIPVKDVKVKEKTQKKSILSRLSVLITAFGRPLRPKTTLDIRNRHNIMNLFILFSLIYLGQKFPVGWKSSLIKVRPARQT